MAVKYYVDEKKRKTVAVLEGCKHDACNRIVKLIGDNILVPYWSKKLCMPDVIKAIVTWHEGDEYDVEEGKRQAKKKLMSNYHRAMDKRMQMFTEDLLAAANVLKTENS